MRHWKGNWWSAYILWRPIQEIGKCSMATSAKMWIWEKVMLLLLLRRFSRVWLCDPIDGSLPGSPVPRILQARTLEWVAISFSNAWKWKVKVKSLSRARLLATPWTAAYQASIHGIFQARVLEWVAIVLWEVVRQREREILTHVFNEALWQVF